MKYGFVVPVYNHGATLEDVVKNLLPYEFPIIVVDDGNDEKNKAFIRDVEKKYPLVTVVERKKKWRKGQGYGKWLEKSARNGSYSYFAD